MIHFGNRFVSRRQQFAIVRHSRFAHIDIIPNIAAGTLVFAIPTSLKGA